MQPQTFSFKSVYVCDCFRTQKKKGLFFLLVRVSTRSPGAWKEFEQCFKKAKAPFSKENENLETLITAVCRLGNLDLLKFFIEKGGKLDSPDKRSVCAIHVASYYGHSDLLTFICDQNVDLQCCDQYGNQPLHFAAANGKVSAIDYLKRLNADLTVVNRARETPYHIAKQAGYMKAAELLQAPEVTQMPAKIENDLIQIKSKLHEHSSKIEAVEQKTEQLDAQYKDDVHEIRNFIRDTYSYASGIQSHVYGVYPAYQDHQQSYLGVPSAMKHSRSTPQIPSGMLVLNYS